jgi:hypothetical protein
MVFPQISLFSTTKTLWFVWKNRGTAQQGYLEKFQKKMKTFQAPKPLKAVQPQPSALPSLPQRRKALEARAKQPSR